MKNYFAVFRCCTSIPETGHEDWREEFHLFKAESLESAYEQAAQRAREQAHEYQNETGQIVKQHPAQIVDLQEFLFPDEEEAVYQRSFSQCEPATCYDFDVYGHYIAVILEEAENLRTGVKLYNEQIYLLHGITKAEARRTAKEQAARTFQHDVDGDTVRSTFRLIEFTEMEAAPKDGNVHSRFFRDLTAYEAFLKSVEAEYVERKVP